MKLSHLFTKTTKDVSADEVSKNAQLLMKAGYIQKVTAGVYSYLPLGLKVLANISSIVREEMNQAGGQEILMPSLHPKSLWETTGRWETVDVLFKTSSRWGAWEYGLGPTHEEVVVPLVKRFINSYKDLPIAVYQIQNKFRDEARAKSGILRGREFLMKDLYSFHENEADRAEYYTIMIEAYKNVFRRCGFQEVLVTEASGGSFSTKHSHEFQIATPAGEDTVLSCSSCGWAQNTEIATLKAGDPCPKCKGRIEEKVTIEVGNIFDLGSKFSDDFDLMYQNEKGETHPVTIGCYGIGISRLMGALVEDQADNAGLAWPASVAPYAVHLLSLGTDDDVIVRADQAYESLVKAGIEVLYDDREISNGQKFSDADLLGMPVRLLISAKTKDQIEWKQRKHDDTDLISLSEAIDRLKA